MTRQHVCIINYCYLHFRVLNMIPHVCFACRLGRATIVACGSCAMLYLVIASFIFNTEHSGATRSITSRKVRDELINSVSSASGKHRCG